uniref:Baculoviral IAP repeat-containing protein 3-like n=1 Tax=Phallusia mammillata TaxID=59560 RepID=A0A6F9D7U1_9ASCI|nr:baculoviral IAP repeat-containing protein 3-like [Phallusia mammillata]
MSFNVLMQPPPLRPGEELGQYFNMLESYCTSVDASEEMKRHLFLASIGNDLKWAIQEKDSNLFTIPFKHLKERALRHKSSGQHAERQRAELIRRVQLPGESARDFVYALQTLGDNAYSNSSEAALKNKVLYITLLQGLQDRRLAETIPAATKYTRTFRAAAQVVVDAQVPSFVQVATVNAKTSEIDMILKKLEDMERRTTERSAKFEDTLKTLQAEVDSLKRTGHFYGKHEQKRKCYGCGQPGYFRRDCPHLSMRPKMIRVSREARSLPTSFRRPSKHPVDVKESPSQQPTAPGRANRPGPETMPKERIESPPALARFVSILVGQTTMCALLDTGSGVCLMSAIKWDSFGAEQNLQINKSPSTW